jgi:hypothetical protein
MIAGEIHNDSTMVKVLDALREAGLDDEKAHVCIGNMQRKGLLFRERAETSNVIPMRRKGKLAPVTKAFYRVVPPEVS